jgi:hypothetical protein
MSQVIELEPWTAFWAKDAESSGVVQSEDRWLDPTGYRWFL